MKTGMLVLLAAFSVNLSAQDGVVRGTITIEHQTKKSSGSGDAVISLRSYDKPFSLQPRPTATLAQRNKEFVPKVLAITAGTVVEFPNKDPFFHDVFSIYHGRPFDLGLYESGAVRKVAFTKPGVSYIFCNIHPEMTAIVLVLQTPYFAQSNNDGSFQIAHVPPGRYRLEVWQELASVEELSTLTRDLDVTAGDNRIPSMILHSSDVLPKHLNKYGEAYQTERPSY
jgi:plastocyanin